MGDATSPDRTPQAETQNRLAALTEQNGILARLESLEINAATAHAHVQAQATAAQQQAEAAQAAALHTSSGTQRPFFKPKVWLVSRFRCSCKILDTERHLASNLSMGPLPCAKSAFCDFAI